MSDLKLNQNLQALQQNKVELYDAYQKEVALRSKLQVEVRALQSSLSLKTMELASADGALAGLRRYCEDLQTRVNFAEPKSAELIVENEELKSRIEELTQVLHTLQSQ